MYFISFKDRKIHKEYRFNTVSSVAAIDHDFSLIETKNAFRSLFDRVLCGDHHADINYEFVIDGEGESTKEDEEFFLTVVNIGILTFFEKITTEEKRPIEHRLDVPEQLKCLKASLGILKRAVNNITIIDDFNLTFKYKDLIYYLCDENKAPEKGDFVND